MNNRPQPSCGPVPTPVRDFYIGRQPILTRDQSLFGYEMLFRSAAGVNEAVFDCDVSATASVISHAAQLGLDRLIGNAHGFLNVDAQVLMSDIFVFLPREKVVLEIIEGMQLNQNIIERVAQLAEHGFRFALDDVTLHSEQIDRLMPMVDFIKLDLRDGVPATLAELARRYKTGGKALVAEKVETREEFQTCLDLGFDYFQGYYFARPVIITGRKLSTSQMALVNLMGLVSSDAEHVEVERAVKRDVTVALNLLRLVNTPAVGAGRRIDSVSQALSILGRRQLQRWLQIMLFAEPGASGQPNAPLLMLATTRGRMMELLTQKLHPTQRHFGDIAFTVGIMSLMDTLFGMPMGEMLEQMPVVEEVQLALLERRGFLGELLCFVESLEQLDENEDRFVPDLQKLALSSEELLEMEMSAFAWSDTVVRYAI